VTFGAKRLVQGRKSEEVMSRLFGYLRISNGCMHLHTSIDEVSLGRREKKNGGYAVSSSNGWELRALFVRTVGENSVFPSSNHKRASGMIT
jgi:hypothetical protein